MSIGLLSNLDHKKAADEDMRYLIQPRGPGKSWVFRMLTPPDLVGFPNPWNGKAFGREIRKGLGTRHLPTARKRRDIYLGDLRRLQSELSADADFSLEAALQWRDLVEKARQEAASSDDSADIPVEFILYDRIEDAARQGVVPPEKLKRFHRIATGSGFLLELAHSQYVEARRVGNPYGYAPLKQTTIMNLDTAVKHLRSFLNDDARTACLEDVTPDAARRFRDVYLPSVKTPRSPSGLSAQTVTKNINLLKHMWVWAIEQGHLGRKAKNPWEFTKGLRRTTNRGEQVRQDYQPHEFSALLKATRRGTEPPRVCRRLQHPLPQDELG